MLRWSEIEWCELQTWNYIVILNGEIVNFLGKRKSIDKFIVGKIVVMKKLNDVIRIEMYARTCTMGEISERGWILHPEFPRFVLKKFKSFLPILKHINYILLSFANTF